MRCVNEENDDKCTAPPHEGETKERIGGAQSCSIKKLFSSNKSEVGCHAVDESVPQTTILNSCEKNGEKEERQKER